ncbi:Phosphatidylinositide phosphatase SAC2 [Heterocephalus glaber]|uniref:Phosphatidylinositide phosphatase SAC2 n=1 Tax=Heterocephalus glaber TaxID=10181 RepID=G5BVW4_HETGA|nr:Phosphatidylinositide phosphatase SAC2 [Heterocephalus glaber]
MAEKHVSVLIVDLTEKKDLPWWLILIRQKALVGKLPGGHEVCKVTKIAVLSLSEMEPQDLELELCKKHHFGINKPEKIIPSPDDSKFLLKTFTNIKSNASAPNKKKVKESKEKEKLERRLLEELLKMFMDSESFYYSLTYDLTNSVQRQSTGEKDGHPLWQKVDDRFFWNKYMIQDLTEIGTPDVDFWIIPLIQGFVQIEELVVNYNESSDDEKSSPETPPQESTCVDDIHPRFLVALISRRSRHRAGMRYKRRGVDKNGNVANYVETEQLIHVHNHTLSFIQTRGSVPVFWSQVGYRYNPRPRLDKSEKETVAYFCAHFEEQLKIYKKQVIINLVNQTGREKIIGDAYLKQVLLFNNSHLTYVSFDFHEHWVDQAGVICKQEGIFRVNCMDCLDRTNVVQAAIARVVMEQQLKKLGVMPPEQPLPVKCNRIYQIMWANNGDSISRQYAGTAALKGATYMYGYDLMQGIPVTEDLYSIFTKEKEHEALHKESQRSHQELISQLLQSYMKLLLPDDEKFHGGWALIDCDPSLIDATHRDVDVLLLLSNSAYYVAYYDDEVDKVNQYQRLSLENLEKIEIGPEPTLFGKPKFSCMRLYYRYKEASGYFHTLRAVPRNPEEDGKDTLQCIAEMLQITKQAVGLDVPIVERKLERKSSKPHEGIIGIRSQNQGSLAQGKNFLMSKFSSLNQKVKQTKSNVNIGNLQKLGNFTKPEMKVNFDGPGSSKRLLNQDLMERENFSFMEHSHLPFSLANNPSESATSTEKKGVLNVYYKPVPTKRGMASLGDTEEDLEPLAKRTRREKITFPEKILSKASFSSVCLRDILTDIGNGLHGEGQEEREGAEKPPENLARDSVLEDLYSGFRCMGCYQVFPNMRMLKKHLKDGVEGGASCLSLPFAKLRNKTK